jgi:hypothetical protein
MTQTIYKRVNQSSTIHNIDSDFNCEIPKLSIIENDDEKKANSNSNLDKILSFLSSYGITFLPNYGITENKRLLHRRASSSPDFVVTLERLLELTEKDADLDEDEEDEILNPSYYAVSNAIKNLIELYERLGRSFPRGFASLESRGGIILIWNNSEFNKEIRVKIPFSSELQESIYYRHGEDSQLIKNPAIEEICKFLRWLSTDQSIDSLGFLSICD